MLTLLTIRSIQIKRELQAAGLRSVVLIGILIFLIYYSYLINQKPYLAVYVIEILFMFCLSIQINRKDKSFVNNHIHNPHLQIYSEYVALSFPFSVSCLFSMNWLYFPVLLFLLLMLPFIKLNISQRTYFRNISSLIPAYNFEWISGFRKSFLHIIPFYLLSIGFSWFLILPLVFLWAITIAVSSFYDECEPLQILKEGDLSSVKFIRRKLYKHVKNIVVLYLPVLVINTIFNPDYWLINLLFIPVQVSFLCFVICYKYSVYEPNKSLRGNNVIIGLGLLSSLVPFLLPIPLMMAINYYGKSIQNLKTYLND